MKPNTTRIQPRELTKHTLKNGGKLKAIEDALCDKNGYNVRYLGENGKYESAGETAGTTYGRSI